MINESDYFFYNDVKMMSSKSFKQFDAVALGTKNNLFIIPKKSVGIYPFVMTIKHHRYFQNESVESGVLKLIQDASSIEQLEETFTELLENDEKYVHYIPGKTWKKLNKWFKTYNFRVGNSKMNWLACVVKGHEKGAQLKEFYNV